MIEWLISIFWVLAFFVIAYVTIYNLHERSQRLRRLRLEADYAREADYQRARKKAKELEQRQAILEETNREYMDAIRAEEIIKELENGEAKK